MKAGYMCTVTKNPHVIVPVKGVTRLLLDETRDGLQQLSLSQTLLRP